MRSGEQHKELEREEVRTFLAKEVQAAYRHGAVLDTTSIEAEITNLQLKLEASKRLKAALYLIQSQGWQEFDVSDGIVDYVSETYYPFVGTEAELIEIGEKFGWKIRRV